MHQAPQQTVQQAKAPGVGMQDGASEIIPFDRSMRLPVDWLAASRARIPPRALRAKTRGSSPIRAGVGERF